MPAVWNRVLVVAVLAATAGPAVAADPPKPVAPAPLPPTPAPLPLTLFDVLHLAQQGTKEDAILEQLRATNSTFKLSPNDVSMLKLFGVSDRVVAAMSGRSVPAPLPPLPAPVVVVTHASPAPPAPIASPPADPTRPAGAWVREAGPLCVRLTFRGDRLTGEVWLADWDDDGPLTFDADYTVTRDGLLYGVVVGVESDDIEGAAVMQMFAGHTFSARCRCDGGTLTVREVKFAGSGLPGERDSGSGFGMTAQMAAGRYRQDDGKPAAKPAKKAAKRPQAPDAVPPLPAGEPVLPAGYGGMTLPSGEYLKHSPQYFPPDPPFRLHQDLNTMQDPVGMRRGTVEIAPKPRPADRR